ncbi:hypothetical protein AB0H60_36050, partial [Nocardia rhamnosiphila]
EPACRGPPRCCRPVDPQLSRDRKPANYLTRDMTIAMANWIDNFYNSGRRHSYLGYTSPDEYEMLWLDIQPTPQLS